MGLASIQLAKMVEAEIHVTVGSEEKVRYFIETFDFSRKRIFSSRDTSFVQGLMRATDGRGVDLALNPSSGELLHATWRCVAEFGKLIEIVKRDLLGAGKLDMDVFLANRRYSCLALEGFVFKRQSQVKEWVRLSRKERSMQSHVVLKGCSKRLCDIIIEAI